MGPTLNSRPCRRCCLRAAGASRVGHPRLSPPCFAALRRSWCRHNTPPRAEPPGRGGPRRGRGGPFRAATAAARSRRRPARAAPTLAAWAACAAHVRQAPRPARPPGRRLAGAACRRLGTVWAGGASVTPRGAICGSEAALGGPSRARRWPTVVPGPAGAPATLLGRRNGHLHAWIRAVLYMEKFEISSRLYLGMSV